jgi:hypothetical protein
MRQQTAGRRPKRGGLTGGHTSGDKSPTPKHSRKDQLQIEDRAWFGRRRADPAVHRQVLHHGVTETLFHHSVTESAEIRTGTRRKQPLF